jgi:hypothetical protein
MPRTTRTLRTELPADVWQRLADEAAVTGIPLARLVRQLIVARDRRKYPDAQTPDARS